MVGPDWRWGERPGTKTSTRSAAVDCYAEIKVRRGVASNQPRAAVEGERLNRPFEKHDHAALELHEVEHVDQRPDKPSGQAGHVEPEDVRDGSPPTNDCHGAFIEVSEPRKRPPATPNLSSDRAGSVGALLDRDLC